MATRCDTITLTYEENRTCEFQGARLSVSVDVKLAPGETVGEAVAQWHPVLVEATTNRTYEECERLVAEKRQRELEDPAPAPARRY